LWQKYKIFSNGFCENCKKRPNWKITNYFASSLPETNLQIIIFFLWQNNFKKYHSLT
jgi:hypothetical protein